jgi:uncharacterized protein (TIGR03792 family)
MKHHGWCRERRERIRKNRDDMVIEELQFVVTAADREEFLDVEARVWTTFLQSCDGFIHKEVWLPEDDDNRVIAMIWWNTLEQWKRITVEECDAVDREMGEWFRPVDVFRTHVVARTSLAFPASVATISPTAVSVTPSDS